MVKVTTILTLIFCTYIIVNCAETLTDEQVVADDNFGLELIYKLLEPGKTFISQMKSITTAPTTTTSSPKRPYMGIRSRRKHREIPRNSVNTTSNPDNKNTSAEIGTQNMVGQPQVLDRKSLLWQQSKLLAEMYNVKGCPDMDSFYPSFRSILGNVDDPGDLSIYLEKVIINIHKVSHPQAECMAKFFDDLDYALYLYKRRFSSEEASKFHDAIKSKEKVVTAPIVHELDWKNDDLISWIQSGFEAIKESLWPWNK